MSLTVLTKDSQLWKERYEAIEQAHHQATTELHELKPRLSGLESEYKRLKNEDDRLLKERDGHLNQLSGYHEYSQVRHDLTEELESVREFIHLKEFTTETMDPHSSTVSPPLGSSSSHRHTPNQSTGRNRTPSKGKRTLGTSTSQPSGIIIRNIVEKHGLWCGIPSIRSLHPLLGEYIRQLYQDLHDTFTSLQTLQEAHERLQEAQQEAASKGKQWQQESLKYSEKYLEVEEEKKRKEAEEREWSRVSEEMRYVMVSAVQLMEMQNRLTLQLAGRVRGSKEQQTSREKRAQKSTGRALKTKYGNVASAQRRDGEPYEPIESDESEGEAGPENRDGEYDEKPSDQRRREGTRRDLLHLREDEIRLEDLLEDEPTLLCSDRDDEDTMFEQISSPIRRREAQVR
jgi:hypothetical protein